jgi:protein transport protein SEC61 subunit alpha
LATNSYTQYQVNTDFTVDFSINLKDNTFVLGLVYLITAPRSISAAMADPIHAVCYTAIVLTACGVCSQMWVDISGTGARHIAQELSSQGYSIRGHTNRDMTLFKLLNRYIPTAATLGGILVGLISLIADFSGSMISGSSILIVSGTLNYYQVEQDISSFFMIVIISV